MEIQPASFGDNLNEWFRLLGRAWKPLLLSSLVAFVPVAILIGVVFALTDTGQIFVDLMDPDYLATVPDSEIVGELIPLIGSVVVWTILVSVATLFAYLAATRIVAEDRAGLSPTWKSASAHAGRRLMTTVLGAIIVAVGFSLAIALASAIGWVLVDTLGIGFLPIFGTTVVALTTLVVLAWISLSVALFPQVVGMEDTGAAGGLQRSFSLIQGRWWITAGFILVTSLIASAVAQVLGIAFVPLSFVGAFVPQLLALVYAIAMVIQAPLTAAVGAANAIWYLDLRSRREPVLSEQII